MFKQKTCIALCIINLIMGFALIYSVDRLRIINIQTTQRQDIAIETELHSRLKMIFSLEQRFQQLEKEVSELSKYFPPGEIVD